MSNSLNYRTYVFLGGPEELWPQQIFTEVNRVRARQKAVKVIGVDHGNISLLKHGLIPDIAVGDYDSLNAAERAMLLENVQDVRFALPEKDFTDSEMGLATALFDLNSKEVVVIGATGGRLDHFLVNLLCVLNERLRPVADRINMVDQQNLIRFFNHGQWSIDRLKEYKYLAFVNLTPVAHFQIADAKYQLADFSSDYPVSFASNEFVKDEVNFSFTKGVVAVIYSRD